VYINVGDRCGFVGHKRGISNQYDNFKLEYTVIMLRCQIMHHMKYRIHILKAREGCMCMSEICCILLAGDEHTLGLI
jgi:hypothetical protein